MWQSLILFPLKIIIWILSYVAFPFAWAESLLLQSLDQPTSTSFRMFPAQDIFPDYPKGLCYAYALILCLWIPAFISSDRQMDGQSILGMILRPLTKRASKSVVFFIMFTRVWLAAAFTNSAMAHLLTDLKILPFTGRLVCVLLIL